MALTDATLQNLGSEGKLHTDPEIKKDVDELIAQIPSNNPHPSSVHINDYVETVRRTKKNKINNKRACLSIFVVRILEPRKYQRGGKKMRTKKRFG
eukprot:37126-Prorocentrum_minimum.AAC.3